MLKITYSTQFKRDLKRIKKRGGNMKELHGIMTKLATQIKLELKNRDHNLTGNYADYRECHIEPDWLLIYKTTDDEIYFSRTGSHADLF